MPGFPTVIRDARAGRDPDKVTPEGGEILAEYEADEPITDGQATIDVPGIGPLPVVAIKQEIGEDSFIQIVHVGDDL